MSEGEAVEFNDPVADYVFGPLNTDLAPPPASKTFIMQSKTVSEQLADAIPSKKSYNSVCRRLEKRAKEEYKEAIPSELVENTELVEERYSTRDDTYDGFEERDPTSMSDSELRTEILTLRMKLHNIKKENAQLEKRLQEREAEVA